MTREEIVEIIQQTKAEFLNEEVVRESDLETTQEQSYAKGWNACNRRWIRIFDEYLSKLQVEPTECSCDQIKWERDMAIAQLKELGYGLGEKPRTGHWIHLKHGKGICSECHDVVLIAQMYGNANYCPNCGVRMVEPHESEG